MADSSNIDGDIHHLDHNWWELALRLAPTATPIYREASRYLKRLIARGAFKTMLRSEKAAASAVVRVDFGAARLVVAV